jgi:hypothetical protein
VTRPARGEGTVPELFELRSIGLKTELFSSLPAILQISDHHHADDAEKQLPPCVSNAILIALGAKSAIP